ncbi:MAG TPA: HlyD family efflux transporter periplasmic adaptor subunit [Pirellulales bacterium]|nr:HlyD family efflux transporter periplasmic adaptor subunit [Pirellulales bacterium]
MCAMSLEQRTELRPQRLENGQAMRPRGRKRGGAGKWLLLLLVLGLAGGGGGGYLVWSASREEDDSNQALVKPVTKSDLIISVVEDGNLESASNVDLKCKVEAAGRAGATGGAATTILWIIPDGTEVKKDDPLVQLDSSSIEEEIDQQKITLADATAAKIGAEKDFLAAKIAVEEYEEGTLKQELEQIEADITQARQNLSSAQNSLDYTKKMHRQGYRTTLELESATSLVLQSKLNLGVALTKKTVLETYHSKMMLADLEGKRDAFGAKLEGQRESYKLQEKKLQKLEKNLVECKLTAPQDGMVVYANDAGDRRGGQQTVKIEEGAAVRQYQTIIRLPDLSQMQVKALVHESKVDLLRVGMRANVKIQDRDYQGTVKQVATQPEPGNWMSSGVKEYATIVTIDGRPGDLKPGMTAEVEILVAEKKDVLSVPVQAVVEQGRKFYAWVKAGAKPEKRTVVLGATNDTFIEIKDGLLEGDLVLLNPRAVVADAREDVPQDEVVDVSAKFGATASSVQLPEGDTPKPPVKGDPSVAPALPGAAAAGVAPGGAPGAGGTGPGGPGARGPGGGPGGRGGGPGGGQFKMPTFKEMDKDADGNLVEEELPEMMRRGFARWDADSDGKVTRKEFNDAMERMKQWRQQQGGGPGGGQGGGGPPQ